VLVIEMLEVTMMGEKGSESQQSHAVRRTADEPYPEVIKEGDAVKSRCTCK
jgi:hypothetical protein